MEGQAPAVYPQFIHDGGPVQEVLQQAHAELRQLMQQRAEIVRKIGTVKQTISGLANLFGEGILGDELLQLLDRKPSGRQVGFTRACRTILMSAKRAVTAREMCERIQADMPQVLERHKDPMASATTVLNRLVAYGEAKAVTLENGRRAWEWMCEEESPPQGRQVA
jgi:hypothetical protein